jgi:hypothetical protein
VAAACDDPRSRLRAAALAAALARTWQIHDFQVPPEIISRKVHDRYAAIYD